MEIKKPLTKPASLLLRAGGCSTYVAHTLYIFSLFFTCTHVVQCACTYIYKCMWYIYICIYIYICNIYIYIRRKHMYSMLDALDAYVNMPFLDTLAIETYWLYAQRQWSGIHLELSHRYFRSAQARTRTRMCINPACLEWVRRLWHMLDVQRYRCGFTLEYLNI